LKRYWLLFAQGVTVLLAALFVLSTLKPEWLPGSLRQPPQASSYSDSREPPPGSRALNESAIGREGNAAAPSAAAAPAPAGRILSYSEAARRATPAVVNILTGDQAAAGSGNPFSRDPKGRRFGDGTPRPESGSNLGSGVIASPDGYILTNHHVLEEQGETEVVLADGRRVRAKLVGSDPETDLAVLKADRDGLPAIEFGDAASAQIGDVVLAIGNPFGVGQTVTMGIVLRPRPHSTRHQHLRKLHPDGRRHQPRQLGRRAGGYRRPAAWNQYGHLLPHRRLTRHRLRHPFVTVQDVMNQIIKHGRVIRGYIGVEPQDVTPELADAFRLRRRDGAIIAGIMRGGPAEKAGVKVGDILTSMDGKPVTNVAMMLDMISLSPPGSTARFRFLRDADEIELPILIGSVPARRRLPRDAEAADAIASGLSPFLAGILRRAAVDR
jgi:serine protease DegQ